METTNSQIRKTTTKTPIQVDSIYKSTFQKEGTQTAMLRQVITITSFYPQKSVANDFQSSLFSSSEYGFEDKPYPNTENRVAFINIPEKATQAEVETKLKSCPEACIYVMKSNHPIISSQQQYAVESGTTTLDNFADSQVVRYPESHEKAGEIVLDKNNKVQYRVSYFSDIHKEDVDMRNADVKDQYVSENILQEIQSVIPADQSI